MNSIGQFISVIQTRSRSALVRAPDFPLESTGISSSFISFQSKIKILMVLSILIATIAAPGLLGSQEAIHQSQSKEKREEHRARRCNLIATCVKSSQRSREINGRPIVLRDGKLWIDSGTEDGSPLGHPYAGYYLPYPDSKYEGLVTTITDVAPILNWVHVDRDTQEVKYGVRVDAQPNITGPFDCTRQDRRLTLDGWEGWCAVEERPDLWALYFDVGDDGLKSKIAPGTRVLEIELWRKEKRFQKEIVERQQDQTTQRAVDATEDAPVEQPLPTNASAQNPGVPDAQSENPSAPRFKIPASIFEDHKPLNIPNSIFDSPPSSPPPSSPPIQPPTQPTTQPSNQSLRQPQDQLSVQSKSPRLVAPKTPPLDYATGVRPAGSLRSPISSFGQQDDQDIHSRPVSARTPDQVDSIVSLYMNTSSNSLATRSSGDFLSLLAQQSPGVEKQRNSALRKEPSDQALASPGRSKEYNILNGASMASKAEPMSNERRKMHSKPLPQTPVSPPLAVSARTKGKEPMAYVPAATSSKSPLKVSPNKPPSTQPRRRSFLTTAESPVLGTFPPSNSQPPPQNSNPTQQSTSQPSKPPSSKPSLNPFKALSRSSSRTTSKKSTRKTKDSGPPSTHQNAVIESSRRLSSSSRRSGSIVSQDSSGRVKLRKRSMDSSRGDG